MPRRPSYLANDFAAKLRILDATRVKVESLLSTAQLDRTDVEAVYAGLFIDAFTSFEALIEQLFLGLFDGSLRSVTQPTKGLFKIKPSAHSREVVFAGKEYADWLPLADKTIPRANRFLQNGGPFAQISPSEKTTLKNAHYLRNALAHKSDAATQKFLASINQQALLPHEQLPAGYLRTCPQGPNTNTQFKIAIDALEAVARKLCS